jgi:hypothetical protein
MDQCGIRGREGFIKRMSLELDQEGWVKFASRDNYNSVIQQHCMT